MGLLDTIRSILGLDSAGDGSDRGRPSERRSTDVRVEHDPDEAADVDAESEAAVKGTDDSPEHETGEALAGGTDAAASTGSLTEEPDTVEESAEPGEATGVTEHAGTETEAAEPAEAAGPTPDEPDVEDAEPAAEGESEEVAESEDEGTTDGTDAGEESVEVISGIGQAYGKRLSDAGVETVADLADSSGISEKRIAGWKGSAEDRLE
jgi:predicted flap endonuclease-1-like 5' DNA nuclease